LEKLLESSSDQRTAAKSGPIPFTLISIVTRLIVGVCSGASFSFRRSQQNVPLALDGLDLFK
jgi:hypothetical protein